MIKLEVEKYIYGCVRDQMEELYSDIIGCTLEFFPEADKEEVIKTIEEAVKETLDWD